MSADIFIIGSDAACNEQLESVLETVGYEVAASSDIEEAISCLEPGRTSLVFIDTSTVGFELGEDIARIQSVISNMEFILIAEYQDPLIEQEALQHGVNNWLYRPFTAPEIILKVAASLEMASSVGMDGLAEEGEAKGEKEESAKTPGKQET
jgi:DNA-binding NtrC family response regulator